MNHKQYLVDVPEGVSGDWRVERFVVDAAGAKLHNLRCCFSPGQGHRTIKPGTYTRLMRGRTVVMSDTPAEIFDLFFAIRKATGSVLVNGLGLGVFLHAIANKTEVTDITVIEQSQDVLALAGSHYQKKYGNRLTLVRADAFQYEPPKGKRFGFVWHDVWNDICGDNWDEMKRLHRKYGRRCDAQGSWCREETKMAHSQWRWL